jgi:hypothetical protein
MASFNWTAAKLRTETIAPWITVVGLAIGGVYTLVEYRNHQRQQRVETTMGYVTRYMSPPLSDHRAVLLKQWQKHESDLLAVLRNASLSSGELLRQYNTKILTMVNDDSLASPIQELVLFFEQLANCVSLQLCERDAVNSMLAGQAQEFLHQYFPYVCYLRNEWNDPSVARQLEQVFNPGSLGKNYCQ